MTFSIKNTKSPTVSLAAMFANASSLLKKAVGSLDSGDIVPDDTAPFMTGETAAAAGGGGGRLGLSNRVKSGSVKLSLV